jgi:hypothetical protein
MIRSSTMITACTMALLLHAVPLRAQERQGPWLFKIDGGGVHQSEADLADSSGGFALDRWFVSGGVDYAWSKRNSIGITLGGGQANYDFNEQSGFGGGAPWNKVDDTRVTLTWRFGFGDNSLVFIVPSLRYNGENDASSSDSRTYGVYAAMAWRLRDNLTIGPGFGIFSRLENSTRFFPLLAIDWDISERWNLSTGRGLAASQGPGLNLSYQLNDDWSLGLGGRYESVEFRLDQEGVAAGGVGRNQSMPLVFTAELKPTDKLRLSVFTGLQFNGKLKLKDAMGDVLEESDYDPALLFGATFDYRF